MLTMFLAVLPVIAISKGLSLSLLCAGLRAARVRAARVPVRQQRPDVGRATMAVILVNAVCIGIARGPAAR